MSTSLQTSCYYLTQAQEHRANAVPIRRLPEKALAEWQSAQPEAVRNLIAAQRFKAKPGTFLILPDSEGRPERILVGCAENKTEKEENSPLPDHILHPPLWELAGLPYKLPAGYYYVEDTEETALLEDLALGWALETYRFTRYKPQDPCEAWLILPETMDISRIHAFAAAATLTRDLINIPACDMGPEALAAAARKVAKNHRARCRVTEGDTLKKRYPTIYAVGQAAAEGPRLIDFRWGHKNHPKVTLVGKGVCFDSGGLDIKPASAMLLMKKDMGGAATVLGLAQAVMQTQLPVRLRVLIPAVENAISANAYRPRDIITTAKGTTVEVGNTDAEGRLILCDALWEAGKESPDLIIDCATLTGAARVALGTDIPAIFSNRLTLAQEISQLGLSIHDPLWPLPLWPGYRSELDSGTAQLSNIGGSYGGAITAALFLNEFVPPTVPWLHLDMMAWNRKTQPGRPRGGEAMGLRALFHFLESRYAPHS